MTDRHYTLGSSFAYTEYSDGESTPSNDSTLHVETFQHPVETVWGGDGEQYITTMESSTGFHFEKIYRENIRSSWSNGQIPILYYI